MCLLIIIIVVENILIIICSRLIDIGLWIYVDFYKINWFCLCIVILVFDGDLFVIVEILIILLCNMEVVVNGSYRFGCWIF